MRKNIFLIILLAMIFVFVGVMNNSAKAEDDPVELLKNSKTPVHLHSLAGGDTLVHEWPMVEDLVCTYWHGIYPPWLYCTIWHCVAVLNYGGPNLDPGDKLRIEYVEGHDSVWVLVEEVTITLKLVREVEPFDSMYVEYGGGYDSLYLVDPIHNPVCTWWHEVWPNWCVWWHIDQIIPEPPIQTCKVIIINGEPWHVVDVATDILVQSIGDPTVPTMTQWGVIILVVLIVGSAVFIMVRRRKATVPA